jgi:hypothetical protein
LLQKLHWYNNLSGYQFWMCLRSMSKLLLTESRQCSLLCSVWFLMMKWLLAESLSCSVSLLMMELLLAESLRCNMCSVSLLMMMKLRLAEPLQSTLSSSASSAMKELLLAEPCWSDLLCSALLANLLLCQEKSAPEQGSLAGRVHSDWGLEAQVLQMMACQVLQTMACVIWMT